MDRRGFEAMRTPVYVQGVDRREQVGALAWMGGLILLALGVWMLAILTSGEPGGRELTPSPRGAFEGSASLSGGGGSDGGPPDGDTDRHENGSSHQVTDEVGTGDPGANEGGTAEGAGTPTLVTIDGICTVEVDGAEHVEPVPRHPWEYAGCAYAPIPVEDRRERWIVVRASMAADDFDGQDAHDRAEELRVDRGGVLWSSHYPSLNPDLWVVYEGPFRDRSAARAAAEQLDGGAYARALSLDAGDRFCIADDGCVGERTE